MENISIFAIFGFGIIILSILIYFMFTKNVSSRRIIFLSFLLMIMGMGTIFICLNHYLVLNQVSKLKQDLKQEIDTIIIRNSNYDEIDYSLIERDSITGEIIYRECSLDTCLLHNN